MALARRFAQQLACPNGLAGRLIGNAMDVANRRPTRLALDLLAARSGERILDAGCGTGAALAMLLDDAAVAAWGIDPSPTMLAAAQRRLGSRASLCGVGMEALPFEDGAFDGVLALNVLYFADAQGAMVSQLHRILRLGGRLVAYVTHRASMESWHFAREGIHRLFNPGELAEALSAGGFMRDGVTISEHAITGSVNGLLAIARKVGWLSIRGLFER